MGYRAFGIFLSIVRLIRFWRLQKYPVPGTRVRVSSYTHRYIPGETSDIYEGEVLGPDYHYSGPFSQKDGCSEEGVYLRGDPRWEQLWVVKLDDELGTLEQHDLPSDELISNYHRGMPILHWLVTPAMWGALKKGLQKVSELPHPIEFYSGDLVTHKNDPQAVRMVSRFSFELGGTVTYAVKEIEAEWKRRAAVAKAKVRGTKRAYFVVDGAGDKYLDAKGSDLTLVRRGNYYHVAHGEPDDLSFDHVTLEVEFWAGLGLWLNNKRKSAERKELSLIEANLKLDCEEIDTVHTERNCIYEPIVLPDRFAKFRERSRAASLEYLASFPGKYPFDILPRQTRAR